ncbi:MAG: AAA family ATPase, partial [Halanaerobiales bacterium]
MRIAKLMTENFKRLKTIEIDFEGKNVVKITGKNEQGKSSILQAIWSALGGKNAMPNEPIRKGEDKSVIRLELDDLLVERITTRSGDSFDTRLKVTDINGDDVKAPQSTLDSLISKIGIRPRDFAESSKDEQVDMLLEVLDLDFSINDFEFYLDGEDAVDGKNPIEVIDNTYDSIYTKRRDINRDKRKEENTLKNYNDVTKTEKVDINSLIKKKDELQSENRDIEDKRKEYKEKKLKSNELEKEINEIEEQIKRLQEKLNNKKDKKNNIDNDLFEMTIDNEGLTDKYEANEEKIEEINQKINDAEDINEQARKYQEKLDHEKELKKLEDKSNSYTKMLESIKEYKEDLIKSAEFPIEDLSFEDGEVY